MRTRNEIENSEMGRSGSTIYGTPKETLILELLLDIRDLLEETAKVEMERSVEEKRCIHNVSYGCRYGCN